MYLDAAGEVVPDASTIGAGAAGVPGTVAGLWQLHRRFGRLTWRADLAPALRYAHDGFRVDRLLVARRDHFAAELHGRTNFLAYFGALASDATFRQSELESTLRRIELDRKSTRLNSSHLVISYAVFCLKKKR